MAFFTKNNTRYSSRLVDQHHLKRGLFEGRAHIYAPFHGGNAEIWPHCKCSPKLFYFWTFFGGYGNLSLLCLSWTHQLTNRWPCPRSRPGRRCLWGSLSLFSVHTFCFLSFAFFLLRLTQLTQFGQKTNLSFRRVCPDVILRESGAFWPSLAHRFLNLAQCARIPKVAHFDFFEILEQGEYSSPVFTIPNLT